MSRVLAVIPARGGSQGLPGKNIREFAGMPLIEHSIRLSKLCPEITRCVVSTDSEEISSVARAAGAETPFLRPQELARPDTPMWPVLRHALEWADREDAPYDYLLLLDPTSPTRLPSDVSQAYARLKAAPDMRGIVAVSEPEFNPVWHCVVEKGGMMTDFMPGGGGYARRQDVPRVFRINGLLYIWRADFVRRNDFWNRQEPHLMHLTPELRAVSIDDLEQFKKAEALVKAGLIPLPWLGVKA